MREPAKTMVRRSEGKLHSNYRVSSVYVERHSIWREATDENCLQDWYILLCPSSSCGTGSESLLSKTFQGDRRETLDSNRNLLAERLSRGKERKKCQSREGSQHEVV